MDEPFIQGDKTFLTINKWEQLNDKLRVGFTTRNGGVSKNPYDTLNLGLHVADEQEDVIKNRSLLAEKLGFPLSNWVCGEQIHGSTIKVINENDRGKGATSHETSIKNRDGLITNQEGILCTAFFADCVPLYFYDQKTAFIGIAHAGWKGTVNRIAESMIEHFVSLGSEKQDILVAIGPSISQKKYEVNDAVINQIDDDLLNKVVVPLENDKFLLDLKQLNVEILLQNGILRHNIDVTSFCSFSNHELFFSHRRDKGKTGRMLGFIGIMKQ